jgi:hypothetical protein
MKKAYLGNSFDGISPIRYHEQKDICESRTHYSESIELFECLEVS